MKQPELGRKILELRTAKGLTQEELVEKCNISVRTIQRIENGEVTPRIYTIKTILSALDYDLSKISDEEEDIFDSIKRWIRKLLFIDIDVNNSSSFIIKQLNVAWIFGIVYFILGFFESGAEYFRYEKEMILSKEFYVAIKILVLITFFFFQRGFILIGGLFNNYLIKIMSVILIFCNILVIIYDIASLFYNSVEREFVGGGVSLTFGVLLIIYGISLKRLRNPIGKTAKYAGIFEILAGCFFLTIVLFFIGFIFEIPAELFEIIIIYKAIQIIKSKQEEVNNT